MSKITPGVRYAEIYRETKETRIEVVLDIDQGTRRDIETGIGFFDHMLQQLAFHGQFNLGIKAEGDLAIDDHHTVEDVGIVIGQAFTQALDPGQAISRYADVHSVMDEALVLVAVDISGRGILGWDVEFKREKIGDLSTECIREFFRAFSSYAKLGLHIRAIAGINDHHICEAIFKGVGRVLFSATRPDTNRFGAPSTKGSI